MKNPKETSRRWLAQAEYNLSMARSLLESGFWSGACFQSEQTAQLALRAFLYSKARRYILIHSIRELIQECGKEDAAFLALADYGGILDRYYLSTRYPDALPAPAIPFESSLRRKRSKPWAMLLK
jgi:HEPN domain-containing protein